MKPAYRDNKDLWAGLMFMGIGAAAIFMARAYPFGTARHMGPGYFPTVLGGLLFLFGIYIMLKGWRSKAKMEGAWSIQPLILLPLALVLFGVLLERAGFIPALAALVLGSAAGGRQFKWVEVLLCAVILIVLSVTVFIRGLGLPYPLIKGF